MYIYIYIYIYTTSKNPSVVNTISISLFFNNTTYCVDKFIIQGRMQGAATAANAAPRNGSH